MKKIIEFIIANKKLFATLFATLLAIAAAAVGLSSCAGIVKATVHRPNDTSSVQINISTGNTSQDITPDVSPDIDLNTPLNLSKTPQKDTIYLSPTPPYTYQLKREIFGNYRFSLRPIKSWQGQRCKSNQN